MTKEKREYVLRNLKRAIAQECDVKLVEDTVKEFVEMLEKENVSYEQGLNDAWELARKIEKMSFSERRKVFDGLDEYCNILLFTPQEALAKLKAYEDSKIEVGDVVRIKDTGTMCVVSKVKGDKYLLIFKDGSGGTVAFTHSDLEKTDKHIDIKSFLEQIGE